MSSQPPNEVPLWQPIPEPRPARPAWMKWLVAGLVAFCIIALLSLGVAGYFALQAMQKWQASMMGLPQPAPATPPAQACFIEVARFVAPTDVASLGTADTDAAGPAETLALARSDIIILDRAGRRVGSFRTAILSPPPPSGGPYAVATPGYRRADLKPATVRGKPAIAAASGLDGAVVVYDPAGRELLRNDVQGTRVTALEVADLNGDGESEILVGRDSQLGLSCLDRNGAALWTFAGIPDPEVVVAADGAGDGKLEVYVGGGLTGASPLVVLDGKGRQIGQWPTAWGEISLAGADLDGDRKAEFVAVVPDVLSQGGSFAARAFNTSLIGLSPKGKETWRTLLSTGWAGMSTASLASGDFDGDRKGEWLVTGPDGTLRAYTKDGVELCRQGMGRFVAALVVTPPEKKGGRARAWVATGSEVLGLDWRKWTGRPAKPKPGATKSGNAAKP